MSYQTLCGIGFNTPVKNTSVFKIQVKINHFLYFNPLSLNLINDINNGIHENTVQNTVRPQPIGIRPSIVSSGKNITALLIASINAAKPKHTYNIPVKAGFAFSITPLSIRAASPLLNKTTVRTIHKIVGVSATKTPKLFVSHLITYRLYTIF